MLLQLEWPMSCRLCVWAILLAWGTIALAQQDDNNSTSTNSTSVDSACIASFVRDFQKELEQRGSSCSSPPASTSPPSEGDDHDMVASMVHDFLATCVNTQSTPLRPIRLLGPVEAQPVLLMLGDEYSNATGFEMNWHFNYITQLNNELRYSFSHGLNALYDGYMYDPAGTVDIWNAGGFVDLQSWVADDKDIQWSDILTFIRDVTAVHDGKLVSLPVTGRVATVLYRRDVLAAYNLSAPVTWDEFLAVAKTVNGTDMNGDGSGDYALCWQANVECITAYFVDMILSSITQYTGLKQGWLFDPSTMEPLVNNAAMQYVLHLMQDLWDLQWPRLDCPLASPDFIMGQCALIIGWTEQFKAYEFNPTPYYSLTHGNVGSTLIPGSPFVYNRTAETLVNCTPTLCPYSISHVDAFTGQQMFVNRAPNFGYGGGGFAAAVNPAAPADYQHAVYRFFSMAAQPELSMRLAMSPVSPTAPFRESHLDLSNLPLWTAMGYDARDVEEFLRTFSASIKHPNVALDLRIHGTDTYRTILRMGHGNLTSSTPRSTIPEVMALMEQQFKEQLNEGGNMTQMQRDYWRTLGYVPPSPPPSPSPSPSPNPSPPPSPEVGSSGLSPSVIAAIVVPVSLAVLVLVSLGVWCFATKSRGHRALFSTSVRPPPASADTTLVVTDIQDSTLLWEVLPPAIMDAALKQHHQVIRAAAIRHAGYESATEGDSFILAFFNAEDALGFAARVQMDMMHATWDAPILNVDMCQPQYMVPVAGYNHDGFFNMAGAKKTALGRMLHSSSAEHQVTNVPAWLAGSFVSVRLASVSDVSSPRAAHRASTDSPLAPQPGRKQPRQAVDGAAGWPTFFSAWRARSGATDYLPDAATNQGASFSNGPPSPGPAKDATDWAGRVRLPSEGPHVAQYYTVRDMVCSSWAACEPGMPGAALAWRGLRVRLGIHTGVPDDRMVTFNKVSGRMQYSGDALGTAKAVCDAGHGGMVLLSEEALKRAAVGAAVADNGSKQQKKPWVVLHRGEYVLKSAPQQQPILLYHMVPNGLLMRLASWEPMRCIEALQVDCLDAPVNYAAVVFMNVVGVSSLMSWDTDAAQAALLLYRRSVVPELLHYGGYLVECADGLCLAAFSDAAAAVRWSVSCCDLLRMAPWAEGLLEHELCEEITIAAPALVVPVSLNTTFAQPDDRPHAVQRIHSLNTAASMALFMRTGSHGTVSRLANNSVSEWERTLMPGVEEVPLPTAGNTLQLMEELLETPGSQEAVRSPPACKAHGEEDMEGRPADAPRDSELARETGNTARSEAEARLINGNALRPSAGHVPVGCHARQIGDSALEQLSAVGQDLRVLAGTQGRVSELLERPPAAAEIEDTAAGSATHGQRLSSQSTAPMPMQHPQPSQPRVPKSGRSFTSHNARRASMPLHLGAGANHHLHQLGLFAAATGQMAPPWTPEHGRGDAPQHVPAPRTSAAASVHGLERPRDSPLVPRGLRRQASTMAASLVHMYMDGGDQDGVCAPQQTAQVLFRGPRIRVGIDCGPTVAHLDDTTRRVAYRGKLMNRAARISAAAKSGQVWVSHRVAHHAVDDNGLLMNKQGLPIELVELGQHTLKGVQETLTIFRAVYSQDGIVPHDSNGNHSVANGH